ncbi:translocation/assembly module TamB domain-containing protein [Nitratifractor sp.]
MKKFIIGLILFVFALLSLAYLALNSPYVIDKIARKYAPEYHFRYDRIVGNPLQGVVLENLYYKDEKLARQIRVRINPYTLLEKSVTISRLALLDVNVTVLEGVIRDFTADSKRENQKPEEESGGLPVAIAAKNIRLTLLPFDRYGVKVDKEELSIDSIYYDSGVFNVGRLKQMAETSLGTVELEGTYRKRYLDVEILAIEDLDIGALERMISTLSGDEKAEVPAPDRNAGSTPATKKEEADPFLPRKIHAKKLWVTLKPYDLNPKIHLEWAQVEGNGLKIDLEKSRIMEGDLRADLTSNLGNARIHMGMKEGRAILQEGVVDSVDLQKILALGGSEPHQSVPAAPAQAKVSTNLEPLDRFPFVPPSVEVRQLRMEFKPGNYEGVDYKDPILIVKGLDLDLHRNRLTAQMINANLDTPLAHLNAEAGIDDQAIHIRHLDLREVSLDALQKLDKKEENASVATRETPPSVAKKNEQKDQKATKGITLPFVPSLIVLEKGRISVDPFRIDPLELQEAKAQIDGVRFDLSKMLAIRGSISVDLQSNLAKAQLKGEIQENTLKLLPTKGNNEIRLKKALFEHFGIPLRAEAFTPIRLKGAIDEKAAKLELAFQGKKILADGNTSFNVDIDRSLTTLESRFADGKIEIRQQSRLAVPQAPSITLDAQLYGTAGHLSYRGDIKVKKLKLDDAKIEKMLGEPRLDFQGDFHSLTARLRAGVLSGSFVSDDFKKGLLKLGTPKPLTLANYVKLPKKLKEATVSFRLVSPIDFTKPLPLDANVTLHSNLAEVEGRIGYDGNLTTDLVTTFPKNSLLKKLDPKLKLSALNPLRVKLEQKGEKWRLLAKSKVLNIQTDYDLTDDDLQGRVRIAGTRIDISGRLKETISAKLSSPSVKKLLSGIRRIYAVEVPRLDGDVALTLKVEKLSKMTLELRSKQFVPDATARIKSPIKNILVLLGLDLKRQSLIVKKYHLEVAGMKLFADKPSILQLQKNRLLLKELWINDSLKARGYYDLQKAKGEVTAKSARFKVKHQNADLEAAIDIRAAIIGEKIDASGKIILLGGTVRYDIQAKHYASDEDIVILQHLKKNKESYFRKNVQLTLYIETKKPLLFKEKNAFVELRPQLSIIKGFDGDLQLMGSIPLAKGGYYIFEGKRFTLQPSSINFTGKATRPLLDINLVYRRYSRTVYISVNGPATEPILNFSSDPYMTREQILSFILFDTVDSGESAGDMLTMVGGGIAKSILGNLGLKVDTLVLTGQGFEVGKKITDKITIIYDQKSAEPKVVVRIQHSKRTETDISIGSESQSVDIIYKREF